MTPTRIEADYLLATPADPRETAEIIAGEQSSGTFVPVPGETPELKVWAGARVERLEFLDDDVPAPSLPSAGLRIAPEDQREYFRTYAQFCAFRAMLEYYRAPPRDAEDNRAYLERHGMPVLALGGDKSFGRGLECLQSLQRVAEKVQGGVIADCGHWLAEEQPEILAERLLAFFGEDAGAEGEH